VDLEMITIPLQKLRLFGLTVNDARVMAFLLLNCGENGLTFNVMKKKYARPESIYRELLTNLIKKGFIFVSGIKRPLIYKLNRGRFREIFELSYNSFLADREYIVGMIEKLKYLEPPAGSHQEIFINNLVDARMRLQLPKIQLSLLELLIRHQGFEGLSLEEVRQKLDHSTNDLRFHLNQLENRGFTKRRKIGRTNYYFSQDVITILERAKKSLEVSWEGVRGDMLEVLELLDVISSKLSPAVKIEARITDSVKEDAIVIVNKKANAFKVHKEPHRNGSDLFDKVPSKVIKEETTGHPLDKMDDGFTESKASMRVTVPQFVLQAPDDECEHLKILLDFNTGEHACFHCAKLIDGEGNVDPKLNILNHFTSKLGLHPSVAYRTAYFHELWLNRKSRNFHCNFFSLLAACLLLAVRDIEGTAISLKKIIASFRDLGLIVGQRGILRIVRELKPVIMSSGKMRNPEIGDYFQGIISDLMEMPAVKRYFKIQGKLKWDYQEKLLKVSNEVLGKMKGKDLGGRDPCGVALGIVYGSSVIISSQDKKFPAISQRLLSEASLMSDFTIRKNWLDFVSAEVKNILKG
jgi:predicted transcriptional regulator